MLEDHHAESVSNVLIPLIKAGRLPVAKLKCLADTIYETLGLKPPQEKRHVWYGSMESQVEDFKSKIEAWPIGERFVRVEEKPDVEDREKRD